MIWLNHNTVIVLPRLSRALWMARNWLMSMRYGKTEAKRDEMQRRKTEFFPPLGEGCPLCWRTGICTCVVPHKKINWNE